ncbi:MAG: hypothetical protein CML06_16600 [Pseudomonadales bacterium]|nr:hypothetical protein [Pseudomonadales bacterium]
MRLIDTKNLPSDTVQLARIDFSENSGEHFLLFRREETLIILNKYPAQPWKLRDKWIDTDEAGYNLSQLELPIKALSWIIKTIENDFWKKPSEGGLPRDALHVDNVIENEDLRIRFTPNCGAENVKGLTIKNYSRKGKGRDWQEMQLPYSLLREDGMLDLLKKVNLQYQDATL